MKVLILLALVAVALAYDNEKYPIGPEILNDLPALKAFQACFVDSGPCTEAMAHHKRNIGEAIVEDCEKCTPDQRELVKGFIVTLKEKLPAEYEEFEKKYDPGHKYFSKLGAH